VTARMDMNAFFGYFQLAALAVFLLVFVGRSVYLFFGRNVNPFALGVGKRGLRRVVELGFLVIFALWLTEILATSLAIDWRAFPAPLQRRLLDSLSSQIAGVALVAAGGAVFILALVSFGASWRIGIDAKTPGGLVTTGVFAFSRNPIFVFLDLYAFGTFLINGTLGFMLFAVVLFAGIHYQILQEESFLRRTYGTPYHDYCRRTPRYISWKSVWRTVGGAGESGETRSPA
jgi:protein-S-isoprenylcysteine O-methyltransferase Ste14